MHYINLPEKPPACVTHHTFFIQRYNHEIGFNVYLPPDYQAGHKRFPILYHLHGWMGSESSEIGTTEKVYAGKQKIVVFLNNPPVIEERDDFPVENMLIDELIPLIENEYRVDTTRESRTISDFSMGGGMAFMYAVKYMDLFSSVTTYAGTYHPYLHENFGVVGEAEEKAA